MVSRYIVLFGITYLRLDIFITWWMSISQSTVVFEAFCISVCSSLHTGAYPISESIEPSTGFIHFWSSCRPLELHTGAYPPSPRSSDLSQASLSFDLVVDPHELSYWGISPPAEFAYIIILVILWFWATWSDHCHLLPVSLCSVRVETAPISIDHRLVSLGFGAAPISIDHLPCQLEF